MTAASYPTAHMTIADGAVMAEAVDAHGSQRIPARPAVRRVRHRQGGAAVMTEPMDLIAAALRKRAENGGRHLHHRDCIHNLPPEEQIALRGLTVEWWTKVIGPLPRQITSSQWETTPPTYGPTGTGGSDE